VREFGNTPRISVLRRAVRRPWIAGLCSASLACVLSGCPDRGVQLRAQQEVDACRDIARVIDDAIVDGDALLPIEALPLEQIKPMAGSCGWVYARCDAELFDYRGPPVELREIVDHCTVPSCPIGPTGSAACERHWREVLDATHPPAALRDGLLAFHRSLVEDYLARNHVELEPEDSQRIADAFMRLWFGPFELRYIQVSPPKR
jgi:hypothetical protein